SSDLCLHPPLRAARHRRRGQRADHNDPPAPTREPRLNSAIIRNCERIGLGLGVAAVLGSIVLQQGWSTTVGVGLGALVALSNLILIRKIVTRMISNQAAADGR